MVRHTLLRLLRTVVVPVAALLLTLALPALAQENAPLGASEINSTQLPLVVANGATGTS